MPWIYLRKLILLLFAMVLLPVHVSAAQIDHKAHVPHFSKLQPFVAASVSPNSSVDFSEVSEESSQSPVSEAMQVLIPLLCLTLNAGRLTYEKGLMTST